MKERAVITLPLSPLKSYEFARLVTPVIGETISKQIGANFYLAVNLLDSFKEREDYFSFYSKNIDTHKIAYKEIWRDVDHVDDLIENINKLIKMGYIYEKEVMMYRCNCGIIEIDSTNINTCNPNKTLYYRKNNSIFCSKCGDICRLYKEKALIFDSTKIDKLDLQFFPYYLNKDIKTFINIFKSSYTIISRKRNTGVGIRVNGKIYNIDIDFLWEVYLSLFTEQEKVVLCGNKELYQLFMVGMLERCLNKNASTIFIGTPIINGINNYNFDVSDDEDIITKKLSIILNLKWNVKQRNVDADIINKLRRMPFDKKNQIYNIICGNNNNQVLLDALDYILNYQFNNQIVMKKVKELRKNV